MLVRKPVFRPGASGDMSSVGSATNNGFAVSVLVFTFVPNNNGGIVVVSELVRGAETLLPHSFPVPGELTRRAVSQKAQHYTPRRSVTSLCSLVRAPLHSTN